ncbi:uncharacterized protein J3R85_016143 [Psidium guajava]|nr:uncharacterized protein J3R85_016143 [Psidium guajava]
MFRPPEEEEDRSWVRLKFAAFVGENLLRPSRRFARPNGLCSISNHGSIPVDPSSVVLESSFFIWVTIPGVQFVWLCISSTSYSVMYV